MVINTGSGNYQKETFRKTLDTIPERHGCEVEEYYFKDLKELREKIDTALSEGVQAVITAGGDGSLAMVADQVRGKAKIGIIPTGTGNSLARVLGIPLSPEKSLKVALTSRATRFIDGLEINGKLYLMYASTGFTSSILQYMGTGWKSSFGRLAYVMAAIRRLFHNKTGSVLFTILIDDREIQIKAAEVLVINTAPWGLGKYKVADNLIDDGKLEVCFIRRGRFQDMINGLIDLSLRERKAVLNYIGQGKEIAISCSKTLSVQADGDILLRPL